MTHLKRLVLVGSLVFSGLIALAVAVGAAGGGPPPPSSSSSSFRDVGANASTFTSKGGAGFSLSVSRSDSSFSTGKDVQTTQVFLSITTDTGMTTFGCLVVPASDFKVGDSLQSASLATTLTSANQQCPGKGGAPLGAKPLAGATAPLAGGPPPAPGPLTLPITINLTWTGSSVVGTSRDSHSFECLTYSTDLRSTTRTASGSASGAMSGLAPGTFDIPQASVFSDRSDQETQGTPAPTCFGF